MTSEAPHAAHDDLPAYLRSVTGAAEQLVHALWRGQRSRARRIARRVLDGAAPAGVDPAEVLVLTLASIADPAFQMTAGDAVGANRVEAD